MEDKFQEKRAINATPGVRHSHEKIDLTVYKRANKYADFYEEGEVFLPEEFLRMNGFDPDSWASEQQRLQFIEQDIPQT